MTTSEPTTDTGLSKTLSSPQQLPDSGLDPRTPAVPNPSSGRPSRNRERISYSDFYKIGLEKPVKSINPSPVAPSKSSSKQAQAQDKKDKTNIIKFKVRNFSSQDGSKEAPKEEKIYVDSTAPLSRAATPASARHIETEQVSDKLSRSSNGLHEQTGPASDFEDLSSTIPNRLGRDRAGTSPLSSVPSDLEEPPDILSEDLFKTHFSLNGNGDNKRQARAPAAKRPASATDFGEHRKPSKSKKIKISSPSKHRRSSPHDLELLPQEAKNKLKADLEIKGRMRDDDQMSNDGHCSACGGSGKLLCCDDCPRSFHFVCIEPPIDEADIPDAPYFCMSCWVKRFGATQTEPGLFHSLMANEMSKDPSVFQLPQTIREFFDNVSTGEFGVYQEVKDQKILRKDRNGFVEELDPHRLRDRQNRPILCYRCGKSPIGTAGMVSCDYCSLHWHFDCVDPPLHGPPSAIRKWMCPLHASDATPTTRRPRESRVVDVSLRRGFQNRGDIEVELPESDTRSMATSENSESSSDEEEESILSASATADMPRIKYRIPARGIVLDFLDSCRQTASSVEERHVQAVLPNTSRTMENLIDIATTELEGIREAEIIASEERIQLLAVKALMQSVGKDKLVKMLKGHGIEA